MPKALVVFYSKSGTTKKLAEELAKCLKADIDGIIDKKSRSGPIGFLTAGRDAMKKKETEIEYKLNPEKYDLVVIGTPVWGGSLTPAVRTYLKKHKLKKAAFFCTCGGAQDKTFAEMEKLAGKPVSVLEVKGSEMNMEKTRESVKRFCAEVSKGK